MAHIFSQLSVPRHTLCHPDMEVRRFALSELLTFSPLMQAFLATVLTWLVTALGAALVLFARQRKPLLMDALLAFGAGVMLASAYFSLLAPGIGLASELGQPAWLTAAAGFFSGGVLLLAADHMLSRRMPPYLVAADSRRRSILLISSITLHNIPEGLAIGVSFGALTAMPTSSALTAAWMLAIGIALQNFPEGAAVSLPLRREGMGRAGVLLRTAQRCGRTARRRAGVSVGRARADAAALRADLRRRSDGAGGHCGACAGESAQPPSRDDDPRHHGGLHADDDPRRGAGVRASPPAADAKWASGCGRKPTGAAVNPSADSQQGLVMQRPQHFPPQSNRTLPIIDH